MKVPYRTFGFHHLTRLLLIGGICLLTTNLTGCKDTVVHGILVARFTDIELTLHRKISIDIGATKSALVTNISKGAVNCTLSIPVTSTSGSCTSEGRVGTVSCDDNSSFEIDFTQTSCHSGYGRSREGSPSKFYFGFSGNLNAALNQMDKGKITSDTSDNHFGTELK